MVYDHSVNIMVFVIQSAKLLILFNAKTNFWPNGLFCVLRAMTHIVCMLSGRASQL